jgi:hypothetical protein
MLLSLCLFILAIACLALVFYALLAKSRVRVWFRIPLLGSFILEADDAGRETKTDANRQPGAVEQSDSN